MPRPRCCGASRRASCRATRRRWSSASSCSWSCTRSRDEEFCEMNPFGGQLLNVIAYTPLVGALLLLLLPSQRKDLIARFATLVAFVGFLVSLPLWFAWDSAPKDAWG